MCVWEKRSLSGVLLNPSAGAPQPWGRTGWGVWATVSRFLCRGWSRGGESEMRGRPPHRCKSSCQEPQIPALSSARS